MYEWMRRYEEECAIRLDVLRWRRICNLQSNGAFLFMFTWLMLVDALWDSSSIFSDGLRCTLPRGMGVSGQGTFIYAPFVYSSGLVFTWIFDGFHGFNVWRELYGIILVGYLE
jgi:hypothetical protein